MSVTKVISTFVWLSLLLARAGAATGDYSEDFEHPFVGLAVFYDEDNRFLRRCSGSLLTPIVFLTAAHCMDGADSARVYFQQDAAAHYDPAAGADPASGYPATCAPGTGAFCATGSTFVNYGFESFGLPDTRDAGLIILDTPIMLAKYGQLAQAGSLDALAGNPGRQNLVITRSGYGLSRTSPVRVGALRERLMTTGQLGNLGSALAGGFQLQIPVTPANSRGGACSGDSGGPVFYGGPQSSIIVAITSFGCSTDCRGVEYSYRTDTAAVLAWILGHVPASEVSAIQVVSVD